MNWKTKALYQNLVSELPESFADAIYYYMQRKLGGLNNINMKEQFAIIVEFLQYLEKTKAHDNRQNLHGDRHG